MTHVGVGKAYIIQGQKCIREMGFITQGHNVQNARFQQDVNSLFYWHLGFQGSQSV